MKYSKKFAKYLHYLAYADKLDNTNTPNVSYCELEGNIYSTPYIFPHNYSLDYLTFIAIEDGTISFNILYFLGIDFITSISYSTDNGESWHTTYNDDNKEENLQINVNVKKGDKILWKGIANSLGEGSEDFDNDDGAFFSSNCKFNIEGNIMSMIYGDDFSDKTILNDGCTFACLFYDWQEELNCGVVDASKMILPAIELSEYCYDSMFKNCTELIAAPNLPATILAKDCYDYMFGGCTSLTTAPELPATTLADSCYQYMFYNCISLTAAPELPATTLETYCYYYMFCGCTSLTTAPELPATTLAIHCYREMFADCTSLTNAPELPATTLTTYCYDSMFKNCTSLTAAPELPATTLTTSCYYNMFNGCTNLTAAPELPATTLAIYCYNSMFKNCMNLNYIKCLATNISANGCTSNWVNGVASSGTFIKTQNMENWTTGNNGIPDNWTILNN